MNLPAAVEGTAESLTDGGGAADAPPATRHRLEFKITIEWALVRLSELQPAIGWTLLEYRLLRPTDALVYNPGAKRGSIVNAIARAGFDAAEPHASPICWLRALRLDGQTSGTLSARAVDDMLEYRYESQEMRSTVTVLVHPATRQVRRARLEPLRGQGYSQWDYDDYEPLPSGTHHPRRVRFEVSNGKVSGETRYRVTSIVELASLAVPERPVLPADAVLIDADSNAMFNGKFERIASSSAGQQARPPGHFWTPRRRDMALVGAGVALVGLAAWRFRAVRRARTPA